MRKMYVVKYSSGSYDDYTTVNIFVTDKKATATKYVTRFNELLKKWKHYFSQFESSEYGIRWLKKEYEESHFTRWDRVRNINKCYWDEIEAR